MSNSRQIASLPNILTLIDDAGGQFIKQQAAATTTSYTITWPAAVGGSGHRNWHTWHRRVERRAYTATLRCKLELFASRTACLEATLAVGGMVTEREAASLAAHRLYMAACSTVWRGPPLCR